MRLALPIRIGLGALGLGLALAITAPLWVKPFVAARIRSTARSQQMEARWTKLHWSWPAGVRLESLALVSATGDTVLIAREVAVEARLGSLLLFHPSVARLRIDGARLRLANRTAPEDSDVARPAAVNGSVAPRLQRAAEHLARALLLPARQLPELSLTDGHIEGDDSLSIALDALTLTHTQGALELAIAGRLANEQTIPFDAQLRWTPDDHLAGRAEVRITEEGHTEQVPLVLTIEGRVHQDRSAGRLEIAPDTRVTVGEMAMRVEGSSETRGPRFRLAVVMDSLSAPRVQRSLPRAVLGPLARLSVNGWWDWHAAVDVDLAHPDSVRFRADVIPHGLTLDAAGSGLRLGNMQEPFVASIHLPHDRLVLRDLSPANPHYRPLEDISEYLLYAVVTNEDGGFFWHRGFNTGAIQLAIAANLRSGAYQRGAGTITMQLARNLYLGHRRTLSRKAQEVVLAWVLEHLVGLPKERLLEIYLNIIEWGPDLHGADEAAQFYFAQDAAALTLPEALFLTLVIPSPSKWRARLDSQGELRPGARAQMQFIARKMHAKGWLSDEDLASTDSLVIDLRGPAREVFAPRDTVAEPDSSQQVVL